jgi:hypothetical protein
MPVNPVSPQPTAPTNTRLHIRCLPALPARRPQKSHPSPRRGPGVGSRESGVRLHRPRRPRPGVSVFPPHPPILSFRPAMFLPHQHSRPFAVRNRGQRSGVRSRGSASIGPADPDPVFQCFRPTLQSHLFALPYSCPINIRVHSRPFAVRNRGQRSGVGSRESGVRLHRPRRPRPGVSVFPPHPPIPSFRPAIFLPHQHSRPFASIRG